MPEYRVIKAGTGGEIDKIRADKVRLRQLQESESRREKLTNLRFQASSGATQLQNTILALLEIVTAQEERIRALEMKN